MKTTITLASWNLVLILHFVLLTSVFTEIVLGLKGKGISKIGKHGKVKKKSGVLSHPKKKLISRTIKVERKSSLKANKSAVLGHRRTINSPEVITVADPFVQNPQLQYVLDNPNANGQSQYGQYYGNPPSIVKSKHYAHLVQRFPVHSARQDYHSAYHGTTNNLKGYLSGGFVPITQTQLQEIDGAMPAYATRAKGTQQKYQVKTVNIDTMQPQFIHTSFPGQEAEVTGSLSHEVAGQVSLNQNLPGEQSVHYGQVQQQQISVPSFPQTSEVVNAHLSGLAGNQEVPVSIAEHKVPLVMQPLKVSNYKGMHQQATKLAYPVASQALDEGQMVVSPIPVQRNSSTEEGDENEAIEQVPMENEANNMMPRLQEPPIVQHREDEPEELMTDEATNQPSVPGPVSESILVPLGVAASQFEDISGGGSDEFELEKTHFKATRRLKKHGRHFHHLVKARCTPNPCRNGGACTALEHGYDCACLMGYKGLHCEQRNHCQPNPCLNNGSCYELSSGYQCQCHKGFSGDVCQGSVTP